LASSPEIDRIADGLPSGVADGALNAAAGASAVAPGVAGSKATWRDYYELTKPKVVMLIAFTAVVGMFLATTGLPPLNALLFGTVGIWLAAASAAAINHVIDQRIDSVMARTKHRPLPTGHVTEQQALTFAFALGCASMLMLTLLVNPLTAVLTFFSLIGYAIVYTVWLKRATPQNIVIGGAAGAAPPVLGWTAVTGTIDPNALLLFLIIFTWTPPHFWALAIARRDEYAKVGMPMLPVTHGIEFTRLHILLYTVLMVLVTVLPYLTGMSGLIYAASAIALNGVFLWYSWQLWSTGRADWPMRTFKYSITYLMLLFAALLVDHYLLFRF
jgi:protoheme IX farnesyltransferase